MVYWKGQNGESKKRELGKKKDHNEATAGCGFYSDKLEVP
jgi:hypothetical protein